MSRRNRKPKRRNPNAPTGYPTDADRAHTAMVDAIKAKHAAWAEEARLREAERIAALTPEQRAREKLAMERPSNRARTLLALAALMGGLGA